MKIQIAILCIVWAALPASAQECPVQQKNQAVLRQSDKFLEEHPDLHGAQGEFGEYLLPVQLPTSVLFETANDLSPREAEVDYLTAPIRNTATLKAAEAQAAELDKTGQTGFAHTIRQRIADASNAIYGKKLNDREMMCISTGEQLKNSAWLLFERGHPEMAEKAYRGVIEIYNKELGKEIPTANALGELARVLASEGKTAEAAAKYQQAEEIYTLLPTRMDADSASVLEAYAEFLSQQRHGKLASKVYDQARAARKNAYQRLKFL